MGRLDGSSFQHDSSIALTGLFLAKVETWPCAGEVPFIFALTTAEGDFSV